MYRGGPLCGDALAPAATAVLRDAGAAQRLDRGATQSEDASTSTTRSPLTRGGIRSQRASSMSQQLERAARISWTGSPSSCSQQHDGRTSPSMAHRYMMPCGPPMAAKAMTSVGTLIRARTSIGAILCGPVYRCKNTTDDGIIHSGGIWSTRVVSSGTDHIKDGASVRISAYDGVTRLEGHLHPGNALHLQKGGAQPLYTLAARHALYRDSHDDITSVMGRHIHALPERYQSVTHRETR